MAKSYPRSTFVGYDIAADAIQRAEGERVEMAVPNAHFAVLDVTQLPTEPQFDVITAFDAIDQVARTWCSAGCTMRSGPTACS
jgi:hypothetical protein